MPDKIFGVDFTDETNPTATMKVSVYNGTHLVDVALSDLYKALPAAAIQALLDFLSTTQGVVLYFNGTDWAVLAPGTAGQVLRTGGAAANPTWGFPGGLTIGSQAQGDVLYFNGTIWTRLAAGTAGQVLQTNGAAANPSWVTAGGGSNSICDGRLTLETGVPVSTTDQLAKTTVYFTPYIGNKIALYDGASVWNVRTFTQISVAVPSTTVTPFDVFCYDNAGTATLETVNWTNDSTRATALVYQDGVLVKSGATTRRYLGTGRTTGSSGQCEDSEVKRFLWNMYNRVVSKRLHCRETTTHSYAGAERKWNNSDTNNKIEAVVGQASCPSITLSSAIQSVADGNASSTPLYEDGASTVYVTVFNFNNQYLGGATIQKRPVAAGYHYWQCYENSTVSGANYVWMWLSGDIQT